MKQKTLLFTAFAGILYLTLSSNATGPAHAPNFNGDKTGRLGASQTCAAAGCHSGGNGTTTCTIEIRRKDWGASSVPVTGYILGKTYLVTVRGDNSAALPKYGFQLTAVGSSSSTPGSFGAFPANVGAASLGSVSLVEHTAPLSGSSGLYQTTFEWTAPATTAGPITFWSTLNAVDGTGDEHFDKPSARQSVTLQDVTSVEALNIENNITVYPNPFSNKLNIKLDNITPGSYMINVYDLRGKRIFEDNIEINAASTEASINTSKWAQGVYFVQVAKDGMSKMIRVIK